MRYILLFISAFFSFSIYAANDDVESCITYEFNEINPKMSELVLKNIFKEPLFKNLSKALPERKVNWEESWKTSFGTYVDEKNRSRTYLEACLAIAEFHNDITFIKSAMKIAAERFDAALKFYSTKESNSEIEVLKPNELIDKFDKIIKDPRVQKEIEKIKKSPSKKT